MRIIIFTGNELRHNAFVKYLEFESKIKVLKVYKDKDIILKKKIKKRRSNTQELIHLENRYQSEKDFFSLFLEESKKKKKANHFLVNKEYLSSKECCEEIEKLKPDLIILYGCSIIKGHVLSKFKNKILNVHLGLSPYYRGGGTNYFTFVNNEPEYAGVTFMYADSGIDTGKIIHQFRPRIYENDDFHTIGNRLIKDMFYVYKELIINFKIIKIKKIKITNNKRLIYKSGDFNELNIKKLYFNFQNNIIKKYLSNKAKRDKKVKIVQQEFIKEHYFKFLYNF
jgi:methionyl-tRNA formyltransferase